MTDIFDDIQTDRPDGGDTLTLEKLKECVERLKGSGTFGFQAFSTAAKWSTPWSPYRLRYPRLRE